MKIESPTGRAPSRVGLYFTRVSHAAVIVGLGPIYILVLAVLLGLERATGHKVVGMLIALGGVGILQTLRVIPLSRALITF